MRSLIRQSSLSHNDTVYEIGSGLGVITSELAAYCKEVVAVEADPKLFERLKDKFSAVPNIRLAMGDFRTFPLPSEPYKVFSNIPFNITSDIVHKLTEAQNPPQDSYLFVQKEAAKKFVGKPYASQETQLSVLMKPWYGLEVVHQFQKNDFQPIPNVDVVLLRIERLKQPLIESANKIAFNDFVTFTFNAKKENLRKALDKVFTYNQIKKLAKDLHFSLQAKPSELDFNQWVGLFGYFGAGVIEEKKQLVYGASQKLKRQQEKLVKVHRTRTAKDWQKVQNDKHLIKNEP